MTRLLKTSSRWGNLYRHRYYIDGIRVSKANWHSAYSNLGATTEAGTMDSTSYGFKKEWIV